MDNQFNLNSILGNQSGLSSTLGNQFNLNSILGNQFSLSNILDNQFGFSSILGNQFSLSSTLDNQFGLSSILGNQFNFSSTLDNQFVPSRSNKVTIISLTNLFPLALVNMAHHRNLHNRLLHLHMIFRPSNIMASLCRVIRCNKKFQGKTMDLPQHHMVCKAHYHKPLVLSSQL